MELVRLSGMPRERGRLIGERFGGVIAQMITENVQSLAEILASRGLPELTEDKWTAMARRGLPYAQEYAPDLVEEMQGVAVGAHLAFEQILAFNYWLDLYDVTAPELSTDLLLGCTTLAATDPATADGRVYVAQNYDLRSCFQKGAILLQVETAPGVEALIFTIAGTVGCAGLNSSGLGVTINKIVPVDSRVGIPYTFVMRRVLGQSSILGALTTVRTARRASGINYTMGHANGEILSVETTAMDSEVLYPLDGWIGHTNHYVHPRLAAFSHSQNWPASDSYLRWGRANKILKSRAGYITLETLKEILTDHANYPQALCCHSADNVSPLRRGNTISSMILDLRALTLEITVGNPCQNPYERFTLEPSSCFTADSRVLVSG